MKLKFSTGLKRADWEDLDTIKRKVNDYMEIAVGSGYLAKAYCDFKYGHIFVIYGGDSDDWIDECNELGKEIEEAMGKIASLYGAIFKYVGLV